MTSAMPPSIISKASHLPSSDFPTGGAIDVSKYNDGQRGGVLKVRAKIDKLDNKTLVITEIPYSKTTGSLIESITKAVEKGKIKARKIEDVTSANVEILVHLTPGTSSDKTMDASMPSVIARSTSRPTAASSRTTSQSSSPSAMFSATVWTAPWDCCAVS